ncbi:hypothetical protein HV144_13070 [Citrobacter freundii]|nr:hypothetical protein [Citrobacter freundii]
MPTVVNIGEGSTIDGTSDTAKTLRLVAKKHLFSTIKRINFNGSQIIETQFMPRQGFGANQQTLVAQL